jgi:hypothetical protein
MAKKPREAKPGELQEIRIMEKLERLSKRPDSRIDLQRILTSLSPTAETYVKHLISSGPSSILSAAKACGLSCEEVEAAIAEIERGLASLR